jgi:hypothetical protein
MYVIGLAKFPRGTFIHPPVQFLLGEEEEDVLLVNFVGLAYQGKKDIVFRFIIE